MWAWWCWALVEMFETASEKESCRARDTYVPPFVCVADKLEAPGPL